MSTKIRWFGVLNDPAYLAPGSILERQDVIVIRSLRDAELVLEAAYKFGDPTWWVPATHLDGSLVLPLGNRAGHEATLTLWHADASPDLVTKFWEDNYQGMSDPYADHIVSVGPRGGIIRERA